MAENWIKGAIKHPGAFTKKAKGAGKSVSAYAKQVTKEGSKASTTTKKQAVLAKTLSGLNKKARGNSKFYKESTTPKKGHSKKREWEGSAKDKAVDKITGYKEGSKKDEAIDKVMSSRKKRSPFVDLGKDDKQAGTRASNVATQGKRLTGQGLLKKAMGKVSRKSC